jgi:DNA-binding transcriptional LysR family regulator
MEQLDLNQTVIFSRVVQAGSFTAAARQLRMPKSTVSRKVSELEARMGARLLQRTTRRLGLTDAGRVYYERAWRIVSELEEAEQAVGQIQAAPRGLLRVTAPLSFGALGSIVAEYLEKHAEVEVEMVCTDRQVDLVEERFDVAIRAGPLADSTLVGRKLGTVQRVLVAAPSYCKRHGIPRAPADLQEHACITFRVGATPNVWVLESGGKEAAVHIKPRLSVNELEVMRAAAIAGLGIAWMPIGACAEDIRKGRLRLLLPNWRSAEVPVHALYPTTRHLSPKVLTFVELLSKRLRLHL